MIELQTVLPQDPRSFWESQPHGEIRALARRTTVAVSNFFQLSPRIVSENWSQFRDKAIALLPNKMAIKFDPRRMLIHIIQEIPPDKRVDFTQNMLELISPQIDQNSKNAFIETVYANLKNEENKLVKSILPFFTIEMYSSKSIEITQRVAAIPKEEREDVTKVSCLLIANEDRISGYDVPEIIQTVAAIPTEEREDVIRAFCLLIPPEMRSGFYSIPEIIQAVAAIPTKEREDVTKVSCLLIAPEMRSVFYDVPEIIQTVAAIPVDEREDVIKASCLLIAPEMRLAFYSIPEIIQFVAAIPKEEREEVVKTSCLLISPEMRGTFYGMPEIIQIITAIPKEERESVVRTSCLLITPEMRLYNIPEIIQAVAAIPVGEREDVIRSSCLLIAPEMRTQDITGIIRIVAAIPVNERARIVQEVIFIPANQREEAIRNALFLPPHMGMDVHENNRDQRVKAAIELLFAHQKHITTTEIHKAKDSFIAYLEEAPIHSIKKELAQRALLEPRKNNQDFGPLIHDEDFSILGLQMTGTDLIGRLWIFVSELSGKEQTNAQVSMVSALSDSYSDFNVKVCNQGKTQRLIVAVLQGRLAGVSIEDAISINTSQAIEMFFNIEAHKKIDELKNLMEAAQQFCKDHTYVNKDTFIPEIEEYARLQGIEN
jgi:N-acetylglutamate synthase-like GNAT family acetyltransferase